MKIIKIYISRRIDIELLMGALKEFHFYPLSPHGGEGQGEGKSNLFSAPINKTGAPWPSGEVFLGRENFALLMTPPSCSDREVLIPGSPGPASLLQSCRLPPGPEPCLTFIDMLLPPGGLPPLRPRVM